MLKKRLRFGGFVIDGRGEDKRKRAGFGIVGGGESGVFPLTKGGRYI
jgi:hypothetical protein